MSLIDEIAFVAYPSNDVATTRAWYERTLGLVFSGPYVEDGIEKYNEANVADGCFALMASEWLGRPPGSAAGVAFETADLERALQTLRERGVTTGEVFDGPVCRSVSIADPEGNRLTLHERKRRA